MVELSLAAARATEPHRRDAATPLVVDLDDTLLRTDTLLEAVLALIRQRAWLVVLLPVWLLGGRAAFKRQLSRHAAPPVATLPINEPLLRWLTDQRAAGRPLHLFSAADQSVVDAVADRFAIFDTARGSDGVVNLSGARKLAAIRLAVGSAFTYAGDHGRDLPIWHGCGSAVVVGRVAKLCTALGAGVDIVAAFPSVRADRRVWRRALRIHQWTKNALVFVALLLGGDIAADLPETLAGFVVFGLVASATYLANDMLDLPHDRLHRSKRHRPIASGAIGLRDAMLAIGLLCVLACAIVAFLPAAFALAVALYVLVTLSYSARLKRMLMLDVFVLAGLFTLRIDAGIVLVGHPIAPWLLAFSMFFFLSLACVKRYGECLAVALDGAVDVPGRAYRTTDAPWLMAMGAASGFAAISTFFLFLVEAGSPILLYPNPRWMWLICVILGYWICRTWALAARGEMNDDPVLFALRDRLSLVMVGATAVLVILARN